MRQLLKIGFAVTLIFILDSFLVINKGTLKIAQGIGAPDNKKIQEPTVTIEESTVSKMIVVYVTDSAASSAAITQKFMKILPVELGGFLKKNNLQMAGPPCGWYYSNHFPMTFDIGAPVNQLPVTTEGRIKVREVPGGKAVIAHYYGPYDQIGKGYNAASAWIKGHNKTTIAPPYEVYVGDPGIEKDPYKVLTNIIFPIN